jgi:hypothetical protein
MNIEEEINKIKTRLDRLERMNFPFCTFDELGIKLEGPGSITCDKAEANDINDCIDCYGTGYCTYGKN